MNKQFKTSDFTDEAFKISAVDEPEEYRTIYLENLPLDWDENEIQLRLEQIGTVEKLHLIKNTLGDSLGKVIITYDNIENSIQAMNTFKNKVPFFDPLKIRFYRKYDFTIKKLLEDIKNKENYQKNRLFSDRNRNEVLLIKNVPQHLIKDDLKLFISEFRPPVHIAYPRDSKDEFKKIAYVYFKNEADADYVLKYLHLRWVQNKQLFVTYASNYLDITDFRTRIEQGIKIEDKSLELKYFLRQIAMNNKIIEEMRKIACEKTTLEQKAKLLQNDLTEKNKYLRYKYRLLELQYKQEIAFGASGEVNKLITDREPNGYINRTQNTKFINNK